MARSVRLEVAYENACRLEAGDTPNAIWINDNGPADIQIQDQVYQLKFVQYRKGLKAIEDHMDRYQDYVSGGGGIPIGVVFKKSFYHLVNTNFFQSLNVFRSS